MKPTDWEKLHFKRIAGYEKQVQQIFTEATKEAAAIGALFDASDLFSQPFTFKDYPQTKQRIDKLMTKVHSDIQAVVVNGVTAEWKNSNLKNDELAKEILGIKNNEEIPEKFQKYFNNNTQARAAFLNRVDKGMNLSDRVWKYTENFKKEIEIGLDVGIRAGKPATEMARDLKQYLQEPDRLYRRVRDANGKLQLSKAAKDYHPGQGVYRSSYKNAMRLTRTETNMAYRTADNERYQQLDFIVGYEVKLTNNPGHVTDICDDLKGKYPKTFKFAGWHPHCMCHVTTILKTPEELDKDLDNILQGKPTDGASANAIDQMPENFKQWAKQNEGRIASAKSKPYFIRDNFGNKPVADWFQGRPAPTPAKTPGTAAKPSKIQQAENRIDNLPDGKIFADAKRIDGVFEKSKRSWSEIIEAFESNKDKAVSRTISISDIKITQPNIQAKKVKKMIGSTDELPGINVVRFGDGELAIFDGHHRLMTYWATGRTDIKVNLVKLRTPEQRAAIQQAWDERKAAKLRQGKSFEFTQETKDRMIKKHPNIRFDFDEDATTDLYKKFMGEFDIEQMIDEISDIAKKNGIELDYLKVKDDWGKGLKFRLRGKTASGEEMWLNRTFKIDGNKKTVLHDYFQIPKKIQGKGMSKEIFQSLYKQYKAGGFEKIEVHANIDVGGYTWAKYGFKIRYDALESDILWQAGKKLYVSEEKNLRNEIEEWRKKNKKSEWFPMRILADKKYGKKLLLGTDWEGMIDLTDLAQRKTFEDYLYGKKAAKKAIKTAERKKAIQKAWDARREALKKERIAKIARERIAARSAGKKEQIQKAWDKRRAVMKRKEIIAKAEKRHAARTSVNKLESQKRWDTSRMKTYDATTPVKQVETTVTSIQEYRTANQNRIGVEITIGDALKNMRLANEYRAKITPEFIAKARAAGVKEADIIETIKIAKIPTIGVSPIGWRVSTIEREIISWEKKTTTHTRKAATPKTATYTSTLKKEIKTAEDARSEIARLGSDWFESRHGFSELTVTTNHKLNGSTLRYRGSIQLSKERMNLTIEGLENIRLGREVTENQADAIATFWHEITHNRNKYVYISPGSEQSVSRSFMELANEFVARKTLPEFYNRLGLKEVPYPEFMKNRLSTGYNNMVCNYEHAAKTIGLDMDKLTETVKEKLINGRYNEMEQALNDAFNSLIPKEAAAKITKTKLKMIIKKCRVYSKENYETWLKKELGG